MVHYSCDLCGKEMRETGEPRFVVEVSCRRADQLELRERDLEDDQLDQISQSIEDTDPDFELPTEPKQKRFDMCAECHVRFLKSPFNCQPANSLNFSAN